MLQRLFIHLTLVLLFALTQIGVATHEISHITERSKHSQLDDKAQPKNTAAEQCAQCISYAKVASGVLPAITLALNHQSGPALTLSAHSTVQNSLSQPYAARAPPQIISI